MIFRMCIGAHLIFAIAVTQIALTDGFGSFGNVVSSENLEFPSIFGAQSENTYSNEEQNYDLIFEDEETPGFCSQLLHRRLIQFLKNVEAYNKTRQGRQDDGDGGDDGGDDGDGGDAAGAPVEVLGLELPAAVPQFFKVVAQALVSNESAATVEMGFKALAPVLQTQVTGAISLFANVLGGGSPFAPQGPQPTRAAAPIRQWPSSNTRRPRPRPSQTPLRPNRPNYSEEDYDQPAPGSLNTRPPIRPQYSEENPNGERKPQAGMLPPRRRRTTTVGPRRRTTSKEDEQESDLTLITVDALPPAAVNPLIRSPSAGSLNRFYATTQKNFGLTQSYIFPVNSGGSLSNFYSTTARLQEDSETEPPQANLGSLNQFYSTTAKTQEASQHEAAYQGQIGSLNQFYSSTAKSQEDPQPEPAFQAQAGSLNQFYAPTSRPQISVAVEPQSQAGEAQDGALNRFYASTVKVQNTAESETEAVTVSQIGSLNQLYSGTSKVQETPAAEVEVPEDNSSGGTYSSTAAPAPENNEETEPEVEQEVSFGGSLKQFYSSTPNPKVVIQPETPAEADSLKQTENIPSNQSGNIPLKQGANAPPKLTVNAFEENSEDPNLIQWGALRRFYSSSTTPSSASEIRIPESGSGSNGQEKFTNSLLSSISQIRRKPVIDSAPAPINNQGSSETKITSLPNTDPPLSPVINEEGTTTDQPKRRRRKTTTTESEYYDEDPEKSSIKP